MSFRLTHASEVRRRDFLRHQEKLIEYARFLIRVKTKEGAFDILGGKGESRFSHVYINAAIALERSKLFMRYVDEVSEYEYMDDGNG